MSATSASTDRVLGGPKRPVRPPYSVVTTTGRPVGSTSTALTCRAVPPSPSVTRYASPAPVRVSSRVSVTVESRRFTPPSASHSCGLPPGIRPATASVSAVASGSTSHRRAAHPVRSSSATRVPPAPVTVANTVSPTVASPVIPTRSSGVHSVSKARTCTAGSVRAGPGVVTTPKTASSTTTIRARLPATRAPESAELHLTIKLSRTARCEMQSTHGPVVCTPFVPLLRPGSSARLQREARGSDGGLRDGRIRGGGRIALSNRGGAPAVDGGRIIVRAGAAESAGDREREHQGQQDQAHEDHEVRSPPATRHPLARPAVGPYRESRWRGLGLSAGTGVRACLRSGGRARPPARESGPEPGSRGRSRRAENSTAPA